MSPRSPTAPSSRLTTDLGAAAPAQSPTRPAYPLQSSPSLHPNHVAPSPSHGHAPRSCPDVPTSPSSGHFLIIMWLPEWACHTLLSETATFLSKLTSDRGVWMALSVKCFTLDLGSGHDLSFGSWSPTSGSALTGRSLLGILSLPLPPSAPPLLSHTHTHSLSLKINKLKKLKKLTKQNK